MSWNWNNNTYKCNLKKLGNVPLLKHIYHVDKDYKSFAKRQNRIHGIFKYFFLIPGLFLSRKILGKFLVTKVPDVKQFKNVSLLSDSIDIGLIKWADLFLSNKRNVRHPLNIKDWFKNKSIDSKRSLIYTMRDALNTMLINDTAYLELFNMISYEYSKQLIKTHGTTPKHILYTSENINDVNYFLSIGHTHQKVFLGEVKLSKDGIETIKSRHRL